MHLAPRSTDLVRIGFNGDGGYCIAQNSLLQTQGLLSLGIASEWSFDSDFLARRPGIQYVACDRGSGFLVYLYSALRSLLTLRFAAAFLSVHVAIRFLFLVPPPFISRRRSFRRKWARDTVVDTRRDISVSKLLSAFSNQKGIFVKMDIEGGEYDVFPVLSAAEANRPGTFTGLCAEFHDLKSRENDFLRIIETITTQFEIVHLHVNNCVPVTGDFPDVIEITFAPRGVSRDERIMSLPRVKLDYPNDSSKLDIELEFVLTR